MSDSDDTVRSPVVKRRRTRPRDNRHTENVSQIWRDKYFSDENAYESALDDDFDPESQQVEDDVTSDADMNDENEAPEPQLTPLSRGASSVSSGDPDSEPPLCQVRGSKDMKPNFIPNESVMFKPKRAASKVWIVFAKVLGYEWSFCRACGKRDSWYKDCNSTTSLMAHVKNKHPEILEDPESPSSPLLMGDVSKILVYNDKQRKNKDLAVVDFLALDIKSFNSASNAGFRLLMREMSEARYEHPSVTTLKKLTAERASQLKSLFKDQFIKGKFLKNSVSVTFDAWSAFGKRIMGSTGHALTEDFQLIAFPLGFVQHDENLGSMDARRVSELLDLEFKSMEIGTIFGSVCDGGGNMLGAAELLNPTIQLQCVSHRINRSVWNTVYSEGNGIYALILKAREIVKHFTSNVTERLNFSRVQAVFELPIVCLKYDMEVRWWSSHHMLRLILQNKQVIVTLQGNLDPAHRFSEDEWKTLAEVDSLLDPISEATCVLEGEKYCTLSSVVPMIQGIFQHLEGYINASTVETFADWLKYDLQQRFWTEEKDIPEAYLIASGLDPRFKRMRFLSERGMARFRKVMLTAFKSESSLLAPAQDDEFQYEADDVVNDADEVPPEFLNYMSVPQIIGEFDTILAYWRQKRTLFPTFARMAQKFLAAPASSAPTERVFSIAGRIYEKKRNKLHPDNAANQLFIRGLYPYVMKSNLDKVMN
jgi:hypothetical protein